MFELTEELQERIDIVRHKLKFIEQKPSVACIKNLEPLTLAGDDIAELVSIAGGSSISGDDQTMLQLDPDIIILMPNGYSVEQSMKSVGLLLQLPGFIELKAIKNTRFYVADGDQYFKGSPENLVNSVELLAEIINPKQFIFGHEGEGWIKFTVS